MAKAIVESMETERDKGNLNLGQVGQTKQVFIDKKVEIKNIETAKPINSFQEVSFEELEPVEELDIEILEEFKNNL